MEFPILSSRLKKISWEENEEPQRYKALWMIQIILIGLFIVGLFFNPVILIGAFLFQNTFEIILFGKHKK